MGNGKKIVLFSMDLSCLVSEKLNCNKNLLCFFFDL